MAEHKTTSLMDQVLPELRNTGLLDTVLAEQRKGVLGPKAAAVEEATAEGTKPSGFLGALNKLFGGASDPDLSAEENSRISKNARLQAGLKGIIESQRSGATFLGTLATTALAGQEAGGIARELQVAENEEEDRKRQVQSLVDAGGIDVETLQALLQDAVVRGDTQAIRSLSEVMKSLAGNKPTARTPKFVTLVDEDGERKIWAVDPLNPSEKVLVGTPPSTTSSRVSFINARLVVDPETGEEIRVGINTRTGIEERIPMAADILGFKPKAKASETRNKVLNAVVANGELFDIITGTAPPGFLEDFLIKVGLSDFVGTEQQQLEAAGEIISRTYVFMLSGVTARETEVRAAKKIFMPQRGNKAETLALKRSAARRMEKVLISLGGGGSGSQPSPALLKAQFEVRSGAATVQSFMQRIADGEFEDRGSDRPPLNLTGRR